MLARLVNEFALWQIEPVDASYEAAILDVLRSRPQACRYYGVTSDGQYAARIMRIQVMPAARRGAVLAAERKLLAHWGQALPPWPDPLPQEAARALLARGAADGKRPGLALPPFLAAALLGNDKDARTLQPSDRCIFQQWWLQESLREGAAPAAALNAFRYGTLVAAGERFAKWNTDAAAKPGPDGKPRFPKLASRFHVTGSTTMRVRFDASGKPVEAAVAERDIRVDGIRGVRPVAFENLFDGPSVDYALTGGIKNGMARFELVWRLDDDKEGGQR